MRCSRKHPAAQRRLKQIHLLVLAAIFFCVGNTPPPKGD